MSSIMLRRTALILANLLLPAAVLSFASGFFPYKPMIPGLASYDEHDASVSAPFDKVIFMVVDALRSDFVYGHGTGFEFTQSIIRDGAGIPFTAHATPPTVTMPRVKALTTGSVPSFLDLILNFAESDTSSSLAMQDTWLAQLRARNEGKLVFYGDDTWLKLFPGDFFTRHDGTTSFFVSDFTEVDHNVTRHLPDELANTDWNALIMHYLGMDHIGHKTGPQGPNMLPKQKEMDGIVEMIYETLQRDQHKRTLLVLAGDHGMNAGGNHGGSGPGETEPALLFVSPQLKHFAKTRTYECPTLPREGTQFHFYSKLEQSDVVSTMAALLGFPIPKNSIGVIMEELLGYWSDSDQVKLLERNARQLSLIVSASYGEDVFNNAVKRCKSVAAFEAASALEELACKRALSLAQHCEDRKQALYDYLQAAQEAMSSTASSYNIPQMVIGTIAALLSFVLSIFAIMPKTVTANGAFFSLTIGLYGIMMFASSYVEEEQHLWYWLTPAWFMLITIRSISAKSDVTTRSRLSIVLVGLILLGMHRLAISWNQTGQKHAGEPDIAHTLFPDQHILMWLLVLATYVNIAFRLVQTSFRCLLPLPAIIASVSILPAIIFKLNFAQADTPELVQGLGEKLRLWTQDVSLVLQARIVFGALAILLASVVVLSIVDTKSNIRLTARLQPLLGLFLATQTRASNVPLLLLMDIQARALTASINRYHATNKISARGRASDLAVSSLLLAHTTYFCFGGSNSISTLDLSHAYNGVADYNIAAVGTLLFASNWTGPVWWAMTVLAQLPPTPLMQNSTSRTMKSWVAAEHAKLHEDALTAIRGPAQDEDKHPESPGNSEVWLTYMATTTTFSAASLVAVMAACTALRTHLFIWTVFSPKYLYAMAWSMGWHLLVNGVIGSALWFFVAS